MITRRRVVVALGAGALAPLFSIAQEPARKMARIGYLTLGLPSSERGWLDAFRQGLRDSGYAEGQNIVIESRYAMGQVDKLSALADELVRGKVEVLVTGGEAAALAAQKATRDVPIVFTTLADPVAIGLVASLAKPGANITGMSDMHSDLVSKRLQLLKDILPGATRFGVIFNPANPAHPFQVKDCQAAARDLRVTIMLMAIRKPEDIKPVFVAIQKERLSGLLILGDRLLGANHERILASAMEARLPTSHTQRIRVEAGGMMSYGANFADVYRQSAVYVASILKGAKPADLPVQQPTHIEFAINVKTAKALGIKIPQSVLLQATHVIE